MTISTRGPVPVVLFAYRRAATLRQALAALKRDSVPLIVAFLDGARDAIEAAHVDEVRALVRSVDWCQIRIVERQKNLGLGVSIIGGMTEVFREFESAIVIEDDIVCIPGAYAYLCDALDYYRDQERVMSIGAHTHPRVRPEDADGKAYFDGRFACWGWAAWRRSWAGMEKSAEDLLWQCRLHLRNVYRYGADLPAEALREEEKNIWAVRFCMLHILRRGLCLHPPVPLVRNIGFGDDATNTRNSDKWQIEKMPESAPLFSPVERGVSERPGASKLLRTVFGVKPSLSLSERFSYVRWSIRPLVHAARTARRPFSR